jgi:hypothetical protein
MLNNRMVFHVYMIHSTYKIQTILLLLSRYGPVPYIRLVRNIDGSETNRRIVIIDDNSYSKLKDKGYNVRKNSSEFTISPFVVGKHHYPNEGRSWSFFVPFPESIDSPKLIHKILTEKLMNLNNLGILLTDSWNINIPTTDNYANSGCFIYFKKDVPFDSIAMVRILLDDTKWAEYLPNSYTLRAFWSYSKVINCEIKEKKYPKAVIRIREDLIQKYLSKILLLT